MVIWGRSESCNSPDKNEIKRDVIDLIFLLFYFFLSGSARITIFLSQLGPLLSSVKTML